MRNEYGIMLNLIEQSKRLLQYLATERPQWRIILEDNKVRLITGQLVLSWRILLELETRFGLEVEDVIYTPNYGITVSVKIRDNNV
jgi:hypothetical protein